MVKVGRLEDGRMIGELDGKLFYGAPRLVSFADMEMSVECEGDIATVKYRYGNEVVASGTMGVEFIEDSEQSLRTVTVYDWTPA